MDCSARIEKMFASYGFEVAVNFFDSFDIYYFVDKFSNIKKGSSI